MRGRGAAILGMMLAVLGVHDARAEELAASVMARLQAALDDHLAARREAERITGLALHVSLGDPGPVIEVFSGRTGNEPGAPPITGDTLFQIGSNTKAFTAAVILRLEAEGALDLEQTVGRWLPEYPAWGGVTIRRLLDMTSGIPNYSEIPAMAGVEAADIHHQWTPEALVAEAYPTGKDDLPVHDGWYYSNTNYILAGMIAERAGKARFADMLHDRLLAPLGLRDTFYADGPYPEPVLARLASGWFTNPECLDYEPGCKSSPMAALLGRDMRTNNMSWAGAAGAMVASPRDLARWIRALFGGRVLPPAQLEQMQQLVSMKTGRPISTTTAEDPRGFALGLGQAWRPELGRFWFYEGETLGYRVLFLWQPETDVVITLAANSQPEDNEDRSGELLARVHGILKATRTIPCCR
jgi:D-alanyl-D-alanine carboxypeptidase